MDLALTDAFSDEYPMGIHVSCFKFCILLIENS